MVSPYSVYLFVADVLDFSEAVSPTTYWSKRDSRHLNSEEFQIWVKPNMENDPTWKELFEPAIDVSDILANRNSSAVVLTIVDQRVFAICFGYGFHILNEYLLERDFGLLIAANHLDIERVREAGTRTIERFPVVTRSRRSRGSGIESLVQQQYSTQLTYLDVETNEPNGRTRVRGGTRLVERTPFSWSELPDMLRERLRLYQRGASNPEIYSNLVGSHVHIPRWSDRGQECEREQLALISEHGDDTVETLLPSEYVSEEAITSYIVEFRGRAKELTDLSWNEIGSVLVADGSVTSEHLRSAKVRVIGSDGELECLSLWSVLSVELEVGSDIIALVDGRWLSYPRRYVEWLNGRMEFLEAHSSPFEFPIWPLHWCEEEYNRDVAARNGWLCLDRVLWSDSGNLSRIEICDLVTDSGALVHVKRLSGSQSIAYLASQAVVSAVNLRHRPEMGQFLRDKESGRFKSRFDAPCRDVILAIATERQSRLCEILPIGGKVRLIQAMNELQAMGIRAYLVRIDISEVDLVDPARITSDDSVKVIVLNAV